jgi:AcrR family transcriptional regulator
VNTPDRIALISLRLFNDAGPATVSTGRIASTAEISAGNLYYHFKTKEQIVELLARRFEERLSPIQESLQSIRAVDDLWLALHLSFEIIHQYRFIFRDADYLTRSFPTVRKRLDRIVAGSMNSCLALCRSLATAGVLEADRDEQRILAVHIALTATCWSMFAKMAPADVIRPDDTGRAAYHVLTLLMPYLTADSRHYLMYLRSKYAP